MRVVYHGHDSELCTLAHFSIWAKEPESELCQRRLKYLGISYDIFDAPDGYDDMYVFGLADIVHALELWSTETAFIKAEFMKEWSRVKKVIPV